MTFVPEPMSGVIYGDAADLFSPAFWKSMADRDQGDLSIRLGDTLAEEVTACLLGGYGMPAELGLAAFARLCERKLIAASASASEIEEALAEPFEIAGRTRRYRFPRQKSRYLAASLAMLPNCDEQAEDVVLRDQLATLPGVGLKTASWVVRNIRQSNSVAVLDVHIVRVGRYIGLFPVTAVPSRHYREMEARFVEFARSLKVGAAHLDALIWRVTRVIGHLVPLSPYSAHAVPTAIIPHAAAAGPKLRASTIS